MIDSFNIGHYFYADDSQLVTHVSLTAVSEHHRRLELCVEHLKDWCSSQRLQLNQDKTELIWIGSKSKLADLKQLETNLNICSVVVQPTDSVHVLGFILDSKLSMRQHVGKLSSICFFHLRRLREFRYMLDPLSRQRLVSAFILSRIDFCNTVLVGLLAPLQCVLNAAAWFVAGLPAHAHITDNIWSLHWLPVAYQIRYKLCLVMYAIYNDTSPSYIADTTTRISMISGFGRRRSANTSEFDIPRTRTKFGEREIALWQDHENGMLCWSRSETSPKYLHSSEA